MNTVTILQGHVLDKLRELPENSVHCCVTSPPYFGLRDYQCEGQIGLEKTLEEYIAVMVEVFREVRRVMRPDASLWLNLGDTYAASRSYQVPDNKHPACGEHDKGSHKVPPGLKPKDLCGVPWRVALALQADGWWLRSDIIWAKPNPMPESVTDRPTRSHEYIFLLTKSARYFYDAEAVREDCQSGPSDIKKMLESKERIGGFYKDSVDPLAKASSLTNIGQKRSVGNPSGRNCRSVWNLATEPFPGAHFAVFPKALVEKCIKAGTSEKGVCPRCGAQWVRVVERVKATSKSCPKEQAAHEARGGSGKHTGTVGKSGGGRVNGYTDTLGWQPSCKCGGADLTIINTPIGNGSSPDPTPLTGRKGMNRPRKDIEGSRPITRYEQQEYAKQLKAALFKDEMREEAGPAFDHYLRTDDSGARPIPQDLLDRWIGRGWLKQVEIPEHDPLDPIPATVMDPFMGSGTTCLVAAKLGRDSIGIELKAEYVEMAKKRIKNSLGMLIQVVET